MSDDIKDKKDGDSISWEDIGWFTYKTAVITGAVLIGTKLALPYIGFTKTGIKSGSFAAVYQKKYLGGRIVRGSTFSRLQKIGSKGLTVGMQAAVLAVSAVLAGTHSVASKMMRNRDSNDENTSQEASENDVDDETENDNVEKQEEFGEDNDFMGSKANSTKNLKAEESKKFPVKPVLSSRRNNLRNFSKLSCEDELDSLSKNCSVVELS